VVRYCPDQSCAGCPRLARNRTTHRVEPLPAVRRTPRLGDGRQGSRLSLRRSADQSPVTRRSRLTDDAHSPPAWLVDNAPRCGSLLG